MKISRDEKIKIINKFIKFIKEVFNNKINYSEYGHYSYELIENDLVTSLKYNSFHCNHKFYELSKKHHKTIDKNYSEIISIINFKKEEWDKFLLKEKLNDTLKEKGTSKKINKI